MILKNCGNQTVAGSHDLHRKKILWKSMATSKCFGTIFFIIYICFVFSRRNKRIQFGINGERVNDGRIVTFGGNYL